ncbi:TIGR00730 family Rossman fold protein [Usitatibacter palustris]|uniref:Cytokinin riboside 5'-monophosphate phosphoribohydrolase n=1 Tax=Usitatibacter palustris TaxID=2732487 RepID=A0A6M4H9G8_9PROT|nr:TIGR00730 family Rossman fold protein [Usitatibacter palustris]QJR15363.1 Putative cytokinin riboside 5'-monophosphate phosphoribohydrolase [Usitatibacter palustris]
MKRLCVFSGSSFGANAAYEEGAKALGRELAKRGIGVVYGGGSVGLMGVMADAALLADGEVIGVIPEVLMGKEVDHKGLAKMHVVKSMHERKALMAELSDGFIALPGGWGTFEELFEVLTWSQLGLHRKPCGILNAGGYYDKLLEFLDHAVSEAFVRRENAQMYVVGVSPGDLIDRMAEWDPPTVTKWITRSQT